MDINLSPAFPARREFRIGILGSGVAISQFHLPAYRRAEFNPIAIWSQTLEHATRVADEYRIPTIYEAYEQLLDNPDLEVLDLALPPDAQRLVIEAACSRKRVKGILAEIPLARNYAESAAVVDACEKAGIALAVNLRMRYEPSVIAIKQLKETIGDPVFATIEARAVRHWHGWQKELGFLTLRSRSVHNLDTFRYWFGEPEGIYCSMRRDPRVGSEHRDGLCTYILEYSNGLRCVGIDDPWVAPDQAGPPTESCIVRRVEGLDGTMIAQGDFNHPPTTPLTLRYATKGQLQFQSLAVPERFPDPQAATMAALLIAIENGTEPICSARDHLKTLELVEAAYESASQFSSIGLDRIRKILAAPDPPATRKSVGFFGRLFGKPPMLDATASGKFSGFRETEMIYTPRARTVLSLARKEAERLNHSFIGTEHLLLGLVVFGQGVGANVLVKQGVTLDQLRQRIVESIGTNPEQTAVGGFPYTPRTKKVLALAAEEARALHHTYLGTEHILLGLLREGDGAAGRVLRDLGLDLKRTRLEIINELDPNLGPDPAA